MFFDDLGIDAVSGSEIMNLLGITPYQLDDPIIFNRISEVVKYLKEIPDKSFFVNRITAGKPGVNKLDHVWSYIEVLNKREDIQNGLLQAEKEVRGYSEKEILGQLSEIERSLAADSVKRKDSLNEELIMIRDHQLAYEK